MIEQFGDIVKKVQIDSNILNWLKEALKESHKDKKEYHNNQIENLQKQYTKYTNRLDRLYEDKLDGIITKEFFEEKSKLWLREQQDNLSLIEKHKKSKCELLRSRHKNFRTHPKALFNLLTRKSPGKRSTGKFITIELHLKRRKPLSCIQKTL